MAAGMRDGVSCPRISLMSTPWEERRRHGVGSSAPAPSTICRRGVKYLSPRQLDSISAPKIMVGGCYASHKVKSKISVRSCTLRDDTMPVVKDKMLVGNGRKMTFAFDAV